MKTRSFAHRCALRWTVGDTPCRYRRVRVSPPLPPHVQPVSMEKSSGSEFFSAITPVNVKTNLKIFFSPPVVTFFSVLISVAFLQVDFLPEATFTSGCMGISNIFNFRTEMMYKLTDRKPEEWRCGRESLNEYVTGVFSDVALWDDLSLNICVHRYFALKENTVMVRKSNIRYQNLRNVQTQVKNNNSTRSSKKSIVFRWPVDN